MQNNLRSSVRNNINWRVYEQKLKKRSPFDLIWGKYNPEIAEELYQLKFKYKKSALPDLFSNVEELEELYSIRQERFFDCEERERCFWLMDKILTSLNSKSEQAKNTEHFKRKNNVWKPIADHGFIEIYSEDEIYDYTINEEEGAREVDKYVGMATIYRYINNTTLREYRFKEVKSNVSLLYEYQKIRNVY